MSSVFRRQFHALCVRFTRRLSLRLGSTTTTEFGIWRAMEFQARTGLILLKRRAKRPQSTRRVSDQTILHLSYVCHFRKQTRCAGATTFQKYLQRILQSVFYRIDFPRFFCINQRVVSAV